MNIDQVPEAGAELDRLVAEHVMGWIVNFDQTYVTEAQTMTEAWKPIPPLSMDVKEARRVDEITRVWNVGKRQAYQRSLQRQTGLGALAWARATPLQICRAALVACDPVTETRLSLETEKPSIVKLKESESAFSWQCVGHNPTTWALGRNEDGEMKDTKALVFRLSNGQWGIRFMLDIGFLKPEPSRDTAMEAAERYLKRDDVQAYHAFRQDQRDRISSMCATGARELQECRTL